MGDACVMVLPHQPHVMTGAQAIAAVADTPPLPLPSSRWCGRGKG